VFVNRPVTSEGLMSNVVNFEFGVLMVVVSTLTGLGSFKPPEFGNPGVVFMVHCVVCTAAVKLPLLCARAGDPNSARATIATQENATLRIFEPYFVIMFMIASFSLAAPNKNGTTGWCFTFETSEASFAADAPNRGPASPVSESFGGSTGTGWVSAEEKPGRF
jgi:hypothetical protein